MKLKLIVIGPKACGKTQIANFLSGQTETLFSGHIEPTAGVRVLETEVRGSGSNAINVELWDASGDPR
jgi:GTPase SAR1 family protein